VGKRGRFVYAETSYPPWWVNALVWGGCLIAAAAVSGDGLRMAMSVGWDHVFETEAVGYLAGGAACIVFPVLFYLLFGRLTVGVTRDSVVAIFGVGWIGKTVPLETIEAVESVQYRPIREFGGWGIRGFGGRQAWTIRGDRAVVLHLEDERRLYLGCENPNRMQERIQTAIAQRGSPA